MTNTPSEHNQDIDYDAVDNHFSGSEKTELDPVTAVRNV